MLYQYKTKFGLGLILLSSFLLNTAFAHDPIFGQGPHVVFKNGVEVATGLETSKKGTEVENKLGLEVTYGLTGDWAMGIDIPYAIKADNGNASSGYGDAGVFTKYRFWRRDSLGLQKSAAISLKLFGPTGDKNAAPALGTGTTDSVVGLSYGYESRSWYRWASVRYRQNGTNNAGLKRGSKTRVDFVVGMRPNLTSYTEPDMVYLLELNGEFGDQATLSGNRVANTGGDEWFISPGFMWSITNFSIRGGIQLPIVSNLNGTQEKSDYRAKIGFEWHL